MAPDEVLKLAVQIEENGREFYSLMSSKTTAEKLKSVLNLLASEEEKHKKIFEAILGSLDKEEVIESYSGEYGLYLKALADECVFTKNLINAKGEDNFQDPFEILDFALRIEKNSIILYSEMKENILRKTDILEKVINEERKHFVMISEIKEGYKQ